LKMLSSFGKLAVPAGECQHRWNGHKEHLSEGQGLLAEKLALKYGACQNRSSSLIRLAWPRTPY
jgi:hypothetical protein